MLRAEEKRLGPERSSLKTALDVAKLIIFAFMRVFEKIAMKCKKIEFLLKFCQHDREDSEAQPTVCASSMTAIESDQLSRLQLSCPAVVLLVIR